MWCRRLLLGGLLACVAPPLAAQTCPVDVPDCVAGAFDRPDWRGHTVTLGVNAAVGGLTAGIRQHARGGSFWRGFAAGALGGSAIYAGKWLSAEGFSGAGLVGRQLAAVGASVVRNASEERGLLEQLVLPAGPVRIYLERGVSWRARMRLDLVGTGVLVYRLASDDVFDPGASASAGAPVFRTEEGRRPGWHGNNTAGVILLRDHDSQHPGTRFTRETVFAHERIHLLQYDHALHTWGAPAEQWLLRHLPDGEWISRHIDLGLIVLPTLLLNRVIPYDQRPWEREAHFFSGSR